MFIKVRMTAFMEGEIRNVEIPDGTPPESVLAETFYWGQNDFQPVADRCSVSVSDVIEYDGKLYIVLPVGFTQISEAKYAELLALPRRDRSFAAYDLAAQ